MSPNQFKVGIKFTHPDYKEEGIYTIIDIITIESTKETKVLIKGSKYMGFINPNEDWSKECILEKLNKNNEEET